MAEPPRLASLYWLMFLLTADLTRFLAVALAELILVLLADWSIEYTIFLTGVSAGGPSMSVGLKLASKQISPLRKSTKGVSVLAGTFRVLGFILIV